MKTSGSLEALKYPEPAVLWFWCSQKTWNGQFFDPDSFKYLEPVVLWFFNEPPNTGFNSPSEGLTHSLLLYI